MGQTWTAMRTMMTYSQAQNRRDAVASAKLRLGSTEALKWYRLDDGIESVSSRSLPRRRRAADTHSSVSTQASWAAGRRRSTRRRAAL